MAVTHSTTTKKPEDRAIPAELHKLTVIDFHPHDIVKALTELQGMAASGEIDGLIVALRMTSTQGEPYLFAAAGRLRHNKAEAIGAAALLQNKIMGEPR